MSEPSSPVSEAMERLGDAAVANVVDAVARSTAWAAAVGAAATSPTPASTVPADDLARLAQYRGDDTRTLVWLPSFLSGKALADLAVRDEAAFAAVVDVARTALA